MTTATAPNPPRPLAAFLAVFGLATVGGLSFGLMVGLISQAIYLLFIFPALIGVGAGALLAQSVRRWSFARPALALLAGLLMGLVTYATMRYIGYLFFHSSLRDQIAQQFGVTDLGEQGRIIDELMVARTGMPGFPGYLIFRAMHGTSYGSPFGGQVTTLSPVFTVLLWLFEAAMITVVPAWLAYGAARQPLCARCGLWYCGDHLGSVPEQRAALFLDLVRTDNFRAAGAELLQDYRSTPSLEVYAQHCPVCTLSPVILTVSRATENARGGLVSQEIVQRRVMHEHCVELMRAARTPEAEV